MNRRSRTLVALALAGVVSLAGCLERKEKVTVHADGSLHVALAFKGDAGEFAPTAADRLPEGAPWTVRDEDVPRADGKGTDHARTAEADFRSAAELPESFGAADDPAPLRAKTTLAVEHAKDGKTRWTFERRYAPRAFAWKQRLFDRAFPDELKKSLEHKEGEELSPEALTRAVDALLVYERDKAQVFLEDALAAVDPAKATSAVRLGARERFGKLFDGTWKADEFLRVKDSPAERDALQAKFRSQVAGHAAYCARIALDPSFDAGPEIHTGIDPLEDKLAGAFERSRRVLEATEALQGHSFEVRIAMPAKIVLHDADALEDDGRTAVFKLSGKDLNDREHVLRAVAEQSP